MVQLTCSSSSPQCAPGQEQAPFYEEFVDRQLKQAQSDRWYRNLSRLLCSVILELLNFQAIELASKPSPASDIRSLGHHSLKSANGSVVVQRLNPVLLNSLRGSDSAARK